MPELEINAKCDDSATFIAHNLGVRVEAFWNDKAEEVQLRLHFLFYGEEVMVAEFDGCKLTWEKE